MATAGYNLRWGKGYRSNKGPDEAGKPAPEAHESNPADGGHEEIHEHLRQMHAATGHAHSHVEHHGDGAHTSHHVDEAGQVSGPHEHGSDEEMVEHLRGVSGGEHEGSDEGEDEREVL